MKRLLMLLGFLMVAFVVTGVASASLYQYSGFDFAAGSDLGGQGDWEIVSDKPSRTISAGDLAPDTWTGFVSSGNHVGPDAKGPTNGLTVPSAASNLWAKDGTGGTIYVSAVVKGNNNLGLKSGNGQLLNMQFDGGGMSAYAQYNNGDGSGESQKPLGTSGGAAKLWVWKIEHDGGDGPDTMSAFVSNDPNLDLSVEPAFTGLNDKQQNHDTAMTWRADIANGGNPSSIDELRIATSWEAVVRGVPEPTTFILTSLAGVFLFTLRRRLR